MGKLARDTVMHYRPDTVVVTVNGTEIADGGTITLPVGARSAELVIRTISNGGGVSEAKPADGGPYTYAWTLFAAVGCVDAGLTSPNAPSTRLQTLNPLDSASVTIQLVGRFDTRTITFTVSVPANP